MPLYIYIPKFYTDTVGVSAAAMGGLILAARLLDAASDPLIGVLSDRSRTRFGRRRPYIGLGSLALPLLDFFGYQPGQAQSEQVRFVLRVLYCLLPCCCYFGAIGIALAYPLSRSRHEALLAGIALRRQGVRLSPSTRSISDFSLPPSPNWGAALLFYLLFVAGMVIFVLVPGLKAGSLPLTRVKVALFGLVVYAGYDLTNQATVKDWPVVVTVVDMIWGTILSTAVCIVGYAAGKWLL